NHGGLELAKEAVQRQPGLRVLFTTGSAVTDGMKAMMVDKAAILEKPYTGDQLQTPLSVHFGIHPNPGATAPRPAPRKRAVSGDWTGRSNSPRCGTRRAHPPALPCKAARARPAPAPPWSC